MARRVRFVHSAPQMSANQIEDSVYGQICNSLAVVTATLELIQEDASVPVALRALSGRALARADMVTQAMRPPANTDNYRHGIYSDALSVSTDEHQAWAVR